MSSPVEKIIESLVEIDRASQKPIYLQIAHKIADSIQRRHLPAGVRLPGTRSLSTSLNIHRKTAIAAYEELESQGWLHSIPNKGTFIISSAGVELPNANPRSLTPPQKVPFNFRKSNILDNPFEYSDCQFVFNDGTPDIRLFQAREFSRLYSANLQRKYNQKKMGYFNEEGSEYLKHHFSAYLNTTRGLQINKDHLLITRSTEMSIFILSEILLSPGEVVIVGDPSYFAVNMIFQKSGAVIITVPVDQEGLHTQTIKQICQEHSVRLVYVTPHHHYPTTVTLSARRRLQLLNLAKEHGFVILEDDYDYEFHYEKGGLLPLASVDTTGLVIYIGSFGKSLAPGFRTGFAVGPAELITEMRKYLGIIDRQGDIMMEQALAEAIQEKEIDRHLKKSLQIYEKRRNYCVEILIKLFNNKIKIKTPSGGLALWVEFHPRINLSHLSTECQENSLFIPRTLLYQDKKTCAIRLGFGHLNEDEMESALEILYRAYEKCNTPLSETQTQTTTIST